MDQQTTTQDFSRPQFASDLDMALGGSMAKLLPKYETLPEEFQRERSPWCQVANQWFGHGISKEDYVAKSGIEANSAWRHLRAIMGSWEPKHEHKIAGVGYLMSQWFDLAPKKAP